MTKKSWLGLAASCCLLLAGCSTTLGSTAPSPDATVPSVNLTQSNAAPPHSSVSAMVQRVLPSVVNIRVTSVGQSPLGTTQPAKAEGSGVIIDRNGIILTNNHVISSAVKVTVVFNDNHKPMEGHVIGAVPERDLAVVKVDATDLTPITIGHSDALRPGDPVVAIGFPLGLGGPTVTKGIVSAKDRTIDVGSQSGGQIEHLQGMLQTDAAINPGNSGGALVDLSGQLVGVNSAAASASSAENIGFAISIDGALPVVKQIITQPEAKQAWLGVEVADVDQVVAGQLGLPASTRGAGVVGVIPGSPAESAGLKQGEVIVGIDGKNIASATDLTAALTNYQPGDTVTVSLVSSGGKQSIDVRLADRPATFPAR